MTSIGEQIKEARVAKGMTQDALAEAVHVTRATISHWETGGMCLILIHLNGIRPAFWYSV